MRILALDTSTEWLSVALATGDDSSSLGWHIRDAHVGPGHSGKILPLIQEVLSETHTMPADLDVIAYGAGPGSFTGVRIACGVAQGLALAHNIPLVAVSGLQAMAYLAYEKHGWRNTVSVLDARMQEIYVSAFSFENDTAHEIIETQVCRPERWWQKRQETLADKTWCVAGQGLVVYPELKKHFAKADGDIRPQAEAIGKMGVKKWLLNETLRADQALPQYVRHRVALTIVERQAGEKL